MTWEYLGPRVGRQSQSPNATCDTATKASARRTKLALLEEMVRGTGFEPVTFRV